jgi:hypothetical protein
MTVTSCDEKWKGGLIDAYAHIGDPKYGSLSNLDLFFESLNIERGIVVLGPGLPDFQSLMQAKSKFGSRIRFMGIPFGNTEEQRLELGELQIRMGIFGMRLMPFELFPNKRLIDRLGKEGMWLYAINPFESSETAVFLLNWLECHPEGRVASPHFLFPQKIDESLENSMLLKGLLKHPRFYAILSRQGGVGSTMPYPYIDLIPWIEDLIELVTWKRMLWGSEFPIFYQRNETPHMVRDWLLHLGIELSEQENEDFYRNNALRLFFNEEPENLKNIQLPDWVEKQIDKQSKVYLFPQNPLYLSMDDYGVLLTDYLEKCRIQQDLEFAEYITEKLSECARGIRKC